MSESGVLGRGGGGVCVGGGTIFAPELTTCNGTIFDFFIVTNNFAHAVAGVQRIEGVGTSPHFPVRLLLRGDARRFTVRTPVRPKKGSANINARVATQAAELPPNLRERQTHTHSVGQHYPERRRENKNERRYTRMG